MMADVDMLRTGPHSLNPLWNAQQDYTRACQRRRDAIQDARKQGHSWREIAAAMGLSSNAAYMLPNRKIYVLAVMFSRGSAW